MSDQANIDDDLETIKSQPNLEREQDPTISVEDRTLEDAMVTKT
jgi:hypothetical protein